MKPDGRALDIAVVGLGQAGGNLAAEFYRRGYRALALNTAQTDLSALDPGGLYPALPEERRLYVGLDGYDGAGADPSYGQDCLHEHADRIRAAVLKQAASADAVILCAGLGGGTGSSLAALVEVLKDEELPLIALMTLPTSGESGLAKVNAVRSVNELVDAPLLGWVFADNARISTLNPDVSIVDYYAHVNAEIVDPLDALNLLNSQANLTPIRSFDGEDFRKLLLSGGVINYAVTELDNLDVDGVVGGIIHAVEESTLMPSGFDVGRLSYLGFIIEAPEEALERASIQTFENIVSELKTQTGGAAIYQGIYRTDADRPISMRLIATTQSLPERIREILTDARTEGQVLGQKIARELPTLELGDISTFDLFRTKTRPSKRARRTPARADVSGLHRPAELLENSPTRSRRRRPDRITAALPSPPSRSEESVRAPRRASALAPPGRQRRRSPPPSLVVSTPSARGSSPQAGGGTQRPASPPELPAAAPGAARPCRRGHRTAGAVSSPHEEEVEDAHAGGTEGAMILDGDMALGRSEPPVATDGVDTGDLPDPAMYDELVSRYLQTEGEARQEIEARLELDASSEIDVVRYYAVEAMAKLGRQAFGDALLRATNDDNEAIRGLAAEALRG